MVAQTPEGFDQRRQPLHQPAVGGGNNPAVYIFNNNLTDGYTDTYNDQTDQQQRYDFAMEVERLQAA